MIKWILKKKAAKELKALRPLPLGRKEFEEWSDRIIELAEIPGAEPESLKFALGEMVTHVPPNESFVSYAWFIHRLRKVAANQVGLSISQEIREKRKQQNAEAKILADTKV